MKNLFEQTTVEEFVARINKLTNSSAAQWGKMNVAQMLTHCQIPLNVASGALKPKVNPLIRALFGKSARKQMLSQPEFKKNLPTFKEGVIVDERIFETEKKKLIDLIHNFQQKGPNGLIKDKHPFFGELSVEEWNVLQVKHLDHHLRQFGV